MTELLADQSARQAALDPLQSVCVTAPAGSGKTELLTQRVLTLLARVEQPEQILAITFTRKAAAEMSHRILQALQRAQDEAEPEQSHQRQTWALAKAVLQQDQKQQWQLLQQPNRLQIQTIDSFSASLTRQLPIMSGFGAQPAIQEDAQDLYQQAVHNLFAALETSSATAELLAALLAHLDHNSEYAARLLINLLGSRDQWLMHLYSGGRGESLRAVLEQHLQQLVEWRLQQLNQALQIFRDELLDHLHYAARHLDPDHALAVFQQQHYWPACDWAALPQWKAILTILLTASGSWRQRVDTRVGFPTVTSEGDKQAAKTQKDSLLALIREMSDDSSLLTQLAAISDLPEQGYSDAQWQILEVLTELLPLAVAELMLVFNQQGVVDFTQVSMAALDALGDPLAPNDIALRLNYRIRHILIDEFQDTSSTQFALLHRLLEGWQENNQQNPQAPDTLFIVGDGMQSIYGFRQANVGLFLEARNHGVNQLPLQDLSLQTNFRSSATIVDWVNQVFATAFPARDDIMRGAVRYSPSQSFQAGSSDSEVLVEGFCGEGAALAEAEAVVAKVQSTLAQYPDDSIAILVRTRGQLAEIIPLLQQSGIAWNANNLDALLNYDFIADLFTLSCALRNPADRLSWAALLRMPWLGLDHADLYYLLDNTGPLLLQDILARQQHPQLSDDGRKILQRFVSVMEPALAQTQRKPLRLVVEGCWYALGGACSIPSTFEWQYVEQFFALLEQHPELTGQQFQQLLASTRTTESSVDARVSLMTIHKSKGLEFDTVFLPALQRRGRGSDKPLLSWREFVDPAGTNRLILAPIHARTGDQDAIYDFLGEEAKAAEKLELSRLFYVACTRAAKRLYLSFNTPQPEPERFTPGSGLLAPAWSMLSEQVVWHQLQAVADDQLLIPLPAADTAAIQRLQPDWQLPQWQIKNPLSSKEPRSETLTDTASMITVDVKDQIRAIIGTVVHLLLEQLSLEGLSLWQQKTQSDKQRWVSALLEYHGMPSAPMSSALEQVCQAIDRTLNDADGRWCLDSQHQAAREELDLIRWRNNRLERRKLDRVIFDKQGDCWIIDYKTGAANDGESLQQFVERECRQYRQQLEEYRSWVQAMLEQEGSAATIRLALYFTAIPRLIKLDDFANQ